MCRNIQFHAHGHDHHGNHSHGGSHDANNIQNDSRGNRNDNCHDRDRDDRNYKGQGCRSSISASPFDAFERFASSSFLQNL